MEIKELKRVLAKRAKALEKEWKEEVDGKDRKRPIDYIRTSVIEGQINMVTEVLSMLS